MSYDYDKIKKERNKNKKKEKKWPPNDKMINSTTDKAAIVTK